MGVWKPFNTSYGQVCMFHATVTSNYFSKKSIFSESDSELLPPDLIINEFRCSCIIQSHTVTINIILQRTKWKMFERIILDVYNFSV